MMVAGAWLWMTTIHHIFAFSVYPNSALLRLLLCLYLVDHKACGSEVSLEDNIYVRRVASVCVIGMRELPCCVT